MAPGSAHDLWGFAHVARKDRPEQTEILIAGAVNEMHHGDEIFSQA